MQDEEAVQKSAGNRYEEVLHAVIFLSDSSPLGFGRLSFD